jgi:hypothetical protein
MRTTFAADLPGIGAHSSAAATYKKITLRLMPILLLCNLVAYLDRINIGFAQNAMS